MPWKECSQVDNRAEFVQLAGAENANVAQLCRRFGISRKTGYKWLKRMAHHEGLEDQSRQPRHWPRRTASEVEQAVLRLRGRHPAWGGRKLAARLRASGHEGEYHPPARLRISCGGTDS